MERLKTLAIVNEQLDRFQEHCTYVKELVALNQRHVDELERKAESQQGQSVQFQGDIHVLVVALEQESASGSELPLKKAKICHRDAIYQDPVPRELCAVPMETIEPYRKLYSIIISSASSIGQPLCLLYGPRQFGKTTIANRLWDCISSDPSVEPIYLQATSIQIETEETFWNALSRHFGGVVGSPRAFTELLVRRKKRLCHFIDEMDAMFENGSLISNLIDVLCSWQGAPYFYGFLGTGTYDLVTLYKWHKGGERVSPFNLANLIRVQPFSNQQMSDFFEMIKPQFDFTASTRRAVMDYPAGAPGIFGSLIRFTVDELMWTSDISEWHSWFKIRNFSKYLSNYNWTYCRIQEDLQGMNESGWEALTYVLMHQKVIGSCPRELSFDRLLRMGILIEGKRGTLLFSSEMMRRVCMEAQPVRVINQVAFGEDPFELLCLSLQFMKPSIVGNHRVTNRESPSEAVFQFELYASIRSILHTSKCSRSVLAKARDPGDKRRLDIIISNGVTYGYELKSNKLTKAEIESAVKQAEDYRHLLAIDKMFMVNFVPRSRALDDVYQIEGYPDIKIIHVCFPASCDEYELKYLGEDGEIDSLTVTSIG